MNMIPKVNVSFGGETVEFMEGKSMSVIKHGQGISDEEADRQMDRVIKFHKAQNEAEEKGEHDFTCPLCGGHAHWGRSKYNNHLHTGCNDCKFFIIE